MLRFRRQPCLEIEWHKIKTTTKQKRFLTACCWVSSSPTCWTSGDLFGKARYGPRAKQTAGAGMKYRGAIMCLIWSRAVSVISQVKTAPPPKSAQNQKPYFEGDGSVCPLWKKKQNQSSKPKHICCSLKRSFDHQTQDRKKDKIIYIVTYIIEPE